MSEALTFFLEEVMPGLNQGLWTSVLIIVPTAFSALFFGIIVGILRVYGSKAVVRATDWYVALFRGTPLVVQLFFWYFALPQVSLGGVSLVLSPVAASIIGFTLCGAAYHSEYVRGGLLSIREGQLKAAAALGMTPTQTIVSVVLPQAFRRCLPGCGNEIIYLIKYSSLASVITVNELTGAARSLAKSTWRNIEVFTAVGLYYLALVTIATFLLKYWEKRLSLPGFEAVRD